MLVAGHAATNQLPGSVPFYGGDNPSLQLILLLCCHGAPESQLGDIF
jgi:hypothetical protein